MKYLAVLIQLTLGQPEVVVAPNVMTLEECTKQLVKASSFIHGNPIVALGCLTPEALERMKKGM